MDIYLCQVNIENGGDNIFIGLCLCVCVFELSRSQF